MHELVEYSTKNYATAGEKLIRPYVAPGWMFPAECSALSELEQSVISRNLRPRIY